MPVLAIDHVQLSMPSGEQAAARAFYAGLVEPAEIARPAASADRGRGWFAVGTTEFGAAHERLAGDDVEPGDVFPQEGRGGFVPCAPFRKRIEFQEAA